MVTNLGEAGGAGCECAAISVNTLEPFRKYLRVSESEAIPPGNIS